MFRTGATAKLAGIALALSFATGCASGGGASAGGAAASVAATPAMVEQGRLLFITSCQRCHGPNGENGRFAPSLADDEWLWINPNASDALTQVANLIRTGVSTPRAPGSTGMPPMGGANLTDEQLNALAAYVLSL